MLADSDLPSAMDAIMRELYPAHEPGAAAIVVRDGQTLFRGGYGMAQLELQVPIAPDTVFRIGSITKQITAVAILLLVEEGRLKLSDPLSSYVSDYPTHGHVITIEQLLTHTSGIKSYTDMETWTDVWRKDFSVQELIDFFKYQPMDFAPGTRFQYNNSGYHLLGAIIEKVSGQSYAAFLHERIFAALGMRQTVYDVTATIIPHRAAGYDRGPEGISNAAYLSMTQPYAAGGLLSTVEDLAIWDTALTAGRVVPPDRLAQAWAPTRLADGTLIPYGYGWGLSEWQGSTTIEHGGGIHGFRSFAIRFPAERLFVAVFSNNTGATPPELAALKLAGLAIGKPYPEPEPIAVSPAVLAEYVGIYTEAAHDSWTIQLAGEQLTAQHTSRPPEALIPVAVDMFCLATMPLISFGFQRDASGSVATLELHGRAGRFATIPRAATDVA